jgi:polyhydroxyalkanoate synthesis regulator phasin
MSTATKPAKAPKEKLTLRDTTDLLAELNRYIEEHIDELELNGGALPDDLAAMLDEIEAAQMDRVDAIAAKVDELTGYAATAKATQDRAARRRKVYENTIAAIKAYALREVQRVCHGPAGFVRGKLATLRIQRNSAAAVALAGATTPEAEQTLLADLFDLEDPHPLHPYLRAETVYTLDRKALGAAYEARRAELEADVAQLAESDIPEDTRAEMEQRRDDLLAASAPDLREAINDEHDRAIEARLADMRARYIADTLATEFPGVSCVRGIHLRID